MALHGWATHSLLTSPDPLWTSHPGLTITSCFSQSSWPWPPCGCGHWEAPTRVRGWKREKFRALLLQPLLCQVRAASWACDLYSPPDPPIQNGCVLVFILLLSPAWNSYSFLNKGLHFRFALGLANYVTSSASRPRVAVTMFLSQRHSSCLRAISCNYNLATWRSSSRLDGSFLRSLTEGPFVTLVYSYYYC